MRYLQVAKILHEKCVLLMNSGSLSVHCANHGDGTGRVGGSEEPSNATATATSTTFSATTSASASTSTTLSTTTSTSISASADPQVSLCKGSAARSTPCNLNIEDGLKLTDAALGAGKSSIVLYYSDMWTSTASPTAAEVLDGSKVIIAFEDGRVRIMLLQFTNYGRLAVAPCVLFDFQNQPNTFSAVQRLCVCPWVTRTTQSTSFELIAYSAADNFISHWRLILKDEMISPIDGEECNTRDSSIQVQVPESDPESILCCGVRKMSEEYPLNFHATLI
jgi:hypothetical protein